MVTQAETDNLVKRVRVLVDKYGGASPKLAEVRKWYEIFHRRAEAGAFVVLESEVEKVESAPKF